LTDFDNFCTIRNRNEHSTKQVETVSLQPYYVSTLPGKTKNSTKTADRLLQYILLTLSFQISQKVVQCSFISMFVRKFFRQSLTKIFTFSLVFIENLFSNSIGLILTCKQKLNCRDMRHVTVMTSGC